MSGDFDAIDHWITDRGGTDAPSRMPGSDHPAVDLRTIVVEYPDRPDQCTICPRNITRQQLLTTWITANRSALIDLGDAR